MEFSGAKKTKIVNRLALGGEKGGGHCLFLRFRRQQLSNRAAMPKLRVFELWKISEKAKGHEKAVYKVTKIVIL